MTEIDISSHFEQVKENLTSLTLKLYDKADTDNIALELKRTECNRHMNSAYSLAKSIYIISVHFTSFVVCIYISMVFFMHSPLWHCECTRAFYLFMHNYEHYKRI